MRDYLAMFIWLILFGVFIASAISFIRTEDKTQEVDVIVGFLKEMTKKKEKIPSSETTVEITIANRLGAADDIEDSYAGYIHTDAANAQYLNQTMTLSVS